MAAMLKNEAENLGLSGLDETPAEFLALYAKRPQLIKPGLERIDKALAHLPELRHFIAATPTVLVAGTNGKGTTCGYLYQILSALNLRVGLFTSPHLRRFRERIQCNQVAVDDLLLQQELVILQQALPSAIYEALSFFEVSTLLALAVYRRLAVAVCVFEVGLGGRWDSTNMLAPTVSVITSIGLDHQDFLGTTRDVIAGEKAGIMRSGCPVLWAGATESNDAADRSIRRQAAAIGAKLFVREEAFAWPDGSGVMRTADPRFPGGCQAWTVPTGWRSLPAYLQRNAALAMAAAVALLHDDVRLKKSAEMTAQATFLHVDALLTAAALPVPPSLFGRFQKLTIINPTLKTPETLLLDVCHNVDGARAFATAVKHAGFAGCPALISVFADKDCNGILDALLPVLGPTVLFAGNHERTWRREQLAERYQSWPWAVSLAEAWRQQPARRFRQQPLIVCGSVAVVGEVLRFLDVDVTVTKNSQSQ